MSGSNSSAPGSASAASEPLSFTVHSMPRVELPEARRTAHGRLYMLLVLLICAAPVVASYFTYYVIHPSGRAAYGELIVPTRDIPDAATLPLQDLKGAAVDPQSLKGQWLLVVAADGACDPACERLLYLQRQIREALGRDSGRVDRVWLVTDTPPRAALLPAMAGATVLRTSSEALSHWLQPQAGARLGQQIFLVDPLGRWMMRFPPESNPARIKRDLDRLLRASASWDKEGR